MATTKVTTPVTGFESPVDIGLKIPVGTNSNLPSGAEGMIRNDTDEDSGGSGSNTAITHYNGSNWKYFASTVSPNVNIFTKTLAISYSISGNASTSYSPIGPDAVNDQKSGVLGAAYSFSSSISNTGSTTMSNLSITNATGTQNGVNDTVTTYISATINNIVTTCTSSLTTNANGVTGGNINASYFTLTGASTATGSCTASLAPLTVFPVAYNLTTAGINAGYAHTASATTYTGAGGTYGTSVNVVGQANGVVSLNNYTLTVNISQLNVGTPSGTSSTISTSKNGVVVRTGNGQYSVSLPAGTGYTQVTSLTAGSNTSLASVIPSGASISITNPGISSDTTIDHIFSGTLVSTIGYVKMNDNPTISGPGAGTVAITYTYDGGSYSPGDEKSGSIGTASPGFAAAFTYDTTNYWISSSSISIAPSSTPVYSNPVAAVIANVTVVTEQKHLYQSSIASQGGTGGSGGSACGKPTPLTVYTDSPGLSVGKMVYVSATSNTPYSTNTSAWYQTGAGPIVNFNSNGAVYATGSC